MLEILFDPGKCTLLIGVWPIYRSNCIPITYQILKSYRHQFPNSLSGRVLTTASNHCAHVVAQLYGVPHGILQVCIIILYENVFLYPELFPTLKVFNFVVYDDPRKTVYKKVNRGGRETAPSPVFFG
jgi:hypothetical protein